MPLLFCLVEVPNLQVKETCLFHEKHWTAYFYSISGSGPYPFYSFVVVVADRDELFGEHAGKAQSGVAQRTGGNMVPLQANASGGTSEVSKAKDAMIERGQKLNEIEDQVENMSNEAKIYAQNCQALKNHYKNKKWYQF